MNHGSMKAGIVLGLFLVSTCQGSNYYCRCLCGDKLTAILVERCSNCTSEYCITQGVCSFRVDPSSGAKVPEKEVKQTCVYRESPKDKTIVTLFLIIVLVLVGLSWRKPRW